MKKIIPLRISLIMEGIFEANPQRLNKEQFAVILKINGAATLSHLSRAFIMSVTSLSGLNPPINLPMININQLKKYMEKHFDNEKN
jgi:preprotein translocase subunit SecB